MNLIKSFSYTDDKSDVVKQIDELAGREGKKFSVLLIEILEDYAKKHKDGNPQFTIEQFEDPNFIACPAFYRDGTIWENYIRKSTDEEREKLKNQIILIDNKLVKYL